MTSPLPSLIGARIGTCRITALIGSGGMGDVYRATDERLGRDVAVKVLGETARGEIGWRDRLDREARILASINHPHIGAIYGVEDVGGAPALILELIEGPTLADRVRQGPMAIATAVALAREIAGALAAAHAKGIIHRDLKPSNIVLTRDGHAKVLDFGLAKSLAPVTNDGPTRAPSMTCEGTVLGTAAYMSPEQARGLDVDEQTDVWAFGCVLFEMLSGRRAFDGATAGDVIAAILKAEPHWNAIPPGTPPNVVRVIRRCLEKNQDRRLHAIADAAIDLQDDSLAPAASSVTQTVTAKYAALAFVAGIALVAAVVVAGRLLIGPRTEPPAAMRFVVADEKGAAGIDSGGGLALSFDGQTIAYSATTEGPRYLYIRRLDQTEPKRLAGTDGGSGPFFSPDGRWIGYFANGKLRKAPLSGGASEAIADAPRPRGGAWGSDGTIVFAPTPDGPLARVSSSGGDVEAVTKLGPREGSHRFPQFLPGGKSIVYATGPSGTVTQWSEASIVGESLTTHARTAIAPRGSSPRYVAPGFVAYVQATQLYAVPIDPNSAAPAGPAIEIAEHVTQGGSGYALYDVANRTMVSIPGAVVPSATLVMVDRGGRAQPLNIRTPPDPEARISPDGTRIAYTGSAPDAAVWVHDLERHSSRQLTTGGNVWPSWSPDSRRVAYTSFRNGSVTPYTRDASGTGEEEELGEWGAPAGWLPDGRSLLATVTRGHQYIWRLDLGSKTPVPLVGPGPFDVQPALSPDGRWLAVVSTESGRNEVLVYPYSTPGDRIQISPSGGNEPLWGPDGRSLYYRHGPEMIVVDIQPGPPLKASAPRVLFTNPSFAPAGLRPNFDVTADGQHFLMAQLEQQPSAIRLTVLLNGLRELGTVR